MTTLLINKETRELAQQLATLARKPAHYETYFEMADELLRARIQIKNHNKLYQAYNN